MTGKSVIEEQKERIARRRDEIEDVISYAWNHRTRVAILCLLNEGTYTAEETAEMLGESEPNVRFHLCKLLEKGSIEIARTEKARNFDLHYYRAVEIPFYDEEEIAAMHPAQRQVTYGLILQSITAEALGSLAAGKMRDDPRVWIGWRRFNVDEEGWEKIAKAQQRHYDEFIAIEAEAVNRRAKSKEEPTSIIVVQMSFERERSSAAPAWALSKR